MYLAVLLTCLATWSIIPALLIGLPRAYGIWLLILMGLPQHAGLQEDVLDHRLNARTVLMSGPLRFIYSNMNYHVEHHMYPMVPYHALPRLHEASNTTAQRPARRYWPHGRKSSLPICASAVTRPIFWSSSSPRGGDGGGCETGRRITIAN